MTTEYQQRIFILGKNLEIFEKSVHSCDIPSMLDNSIVFVDTLKNANKIFENLSPKLKHAEMNTFNRSKKLTEQYFNTRGKINNICISEKR